MAQPDQATQLAQGFAKAYYQAFDTNRKTLVNFFQDSSTLTFEGTKFKGKTAIAGKLMSLGGASGAAVVAHSVKTLDFQQSVTANALVIVATGDLSIDGGNPLKFCETFQLVANSATNFYIHNCIFRLNYA